MKKFLGFLVPLLLLVPTATAFAQSDVRAFATKYLSALATADAEKAYAMIQPAERAVKPLKVYKFSMDPTIFAILKKRHKSLYRHTITSIVPRRAGAPKYKITVMQRIPRNDYMEFIIEAFRSYLRKNKQQPKNPRQMFRIIKAWPGVNKRQARAKGITKLTQQKKTVVTVVREGRKLYVIPGWQAEAAKQAAKRKLAEKVDKLVKEAQRLDLKGDQPVEAMRIINQAAALAPDDFMVKAVLPKVKLNFALFKAMKKVTLTNSPLYGGFIRQVKIKLKNGSGLDFVFLDFVMEYLDEKGGKLASEKMQVSRSNSWNPKGCCVPGYSGELEIIASAPDKFKERTRSVKVRLVRLIK